MKPHFKQATDSDKNSQSSQPQEQRQSERSSGKASQDSDEGIAKENDDVSDIVADPEGAMRYIKTPAA